MFGKESEIMFRLVIAEKPSVAKSLASVLGSANRRDGYLEGRGSPVATSVQTEAPTEPAGETGLRRACARGWRTSAPPLVSVLAAGYRKFCAANHKKRETATT